jgi:hypothetical protein
VAMTIAVRPIAIAKYIQIQWETNGLVLGCGLELKSKKEVLKRV